MEIIKSVKNEMIKQMTALSGVAERKTSEFVPLYGINTVEWAYRAGWRIEYVLISESSAKSLYNNNFLSQFRRYYISDYLNKKITGVSHIIDVCGLAEKSCGCRTPDIFGSRKPVVILERVLDHGNIGTIVRTMRGFGFDKLVMTNYEMDIYYKNIIGASRGEVFNIDFANLDFDKMVSEAEKNDYKIISTKVDFDYDINDICRKINNNFSFANGAYAVVFGNEENGISEQLLSHSDISVGCPMENNVDSLNVGVAAGIVLNRLRTL